jgi:ABC-type nitrate/sulfonate/bicarbonate transport system substrate-binding protein
VVKGTSHLYLAQQLEQHEQDLDDFEEISVVRMPFADAVAAVQEGKIFTSATMIGVLLIEKLMKEGKI